MSDAQKLRVQLADLVQIIEAERQAVSNLRQQLSRLRPIRAPAIGGAIHPEERAAVEFRIVLAAHRDSLSRAEARRDHIAKCIESAKRLSFAPTGAIKE
jgi:hypothetical protein